MSLMHRVHRQRRDAVAAALRLSDADAETVLEMATVRPTHADEVLVRQGEPADCMYVITQGRFEVDVQGASGTTRAVRMLGPGRCFGEIGLIEGAARGASVVSRTEGEVVALSADAAREVLGGNDELAREAQERHAQLDRVVQR